MPSIKRVAASIQKTSRQTKTAEMLEREYLEKALAHMTAMQGSAFELAENLQLAWEAAEAEGARRFGSEVEDVEALRAEFRTLEKKLKELYAKAPEDDWY